MAKRDEKGYFRYSSEELNQIPSYDARAGETPWAFGMTASGGAAGGTFDGTIFGPRAASEDQEGRPTLLTPSQAIGVTPRPPAKTGAGTGNLTGGHSGPSPGGGITLGGEVGGDMEDFHWSSWSEEHSF